jgi:hypothetical protein
MAAPLFYGVGVPIGLIVDWMRRRGKDERWKTYVGLFLLLAPMSLEGVAWSLPRVQRVQAERLLNASPEAVEAALAAPPRFDRALPFYLRTGFPRPLPARGGGLSPGDLRILPFDGGEGAPGELILEVAARGPGFVRFHRVSDSSGLARFLDWQESEVRWEEVSPGVTRVRWTLGYERRLDPGWYFGPWQRYAAGLAAGGVIETVATPS